LEISVLKAIYLAPVPRLIIGITAHIMGNCLTDAARSATTNNNGFLSIGFNSLREK